jgi:hypothetical protein
MLDRSDSSDFAQIMRPLEDEFAQAGVFGKAMPGRLTYVPPVNVRSCTDCGHWFAPTGMGDTEFPEIGVPKAYRCMSCRTGKAVA